MSKRKVNKAEETRKIVKNALAKVKGKKDKLDRQSILKSLQTRKNLNMTPRMASTYYHKALAEVA